MTNELLLPELGISAEEAAQEFEELQAKLVPLWKSIQSINRDEQTIVVVPSLTVDISLSGSELQAYEERYLFLLLLLRQPRARLIYVTSRPILPAIIDYYLDLLPGVLAGHARRRLFLLSPMDATPGPLTRKLLVRPQLIDRIKSLIIDPDRAHLVPFNTTILERDLALRLGIPMYGADPKYHYLGTKSGARTVFAEERVNLPLGYEDLHTASQVIGALRRMRTENPSMREALVKLNEGVSGEGNAVVDLEELPPSGTDAELVELRERLRSMQFELAGAHYEDYMEKLEVHGGVAEERIVADEIRSPSVQLRVTPLGVLELLSTHDQLLGGPSGQSYVGCRFPADPSYAVTISREAEKIGKRLAKEGVLGRFAIDFVVARSSGGEWRPYAIEINLRKGGTTHPFLTLQFLTDGHYDPESALFTTPHGHAKYFVASDHLVSPWFRAFTPDDLFDIVVFNGLHFDHSRQTGVVFHMMSALAECGRLGITAVGNSPEEAQSMYDRTVEVLEQEGKMALGLEPGTMPVAGVAG